MSASFNPTGAAPVAGSVGTYAGEVIGVAATGGRRVSKRDREAEQLRSAISELNTAMKITGTKLSFSVDSMTNQTVVRVVDSDTGELIRQIPSEAMLKISQNITALLGVLLDTAL
jgi:flagellar protein FlaG